MSLTTTLSRLSRDETMLTTKEAATAIGVTPWWVRRLIDQGELRGVNVGGPDKSARWRIDPEDLKTFMRTRESRSRDLLAS